jgi:hypothetical protein
MKIAVIATPRTTTSATCELLAQKYQIQNCQYLIYQLTPYVASKLKTTLEDPAFATRRATIINHILTKDNFVVKFMAYTAADSTDWSQFDQIVFCQRQDTFAQFKSLLYLNCYQFDGDQYWSQILRSTLDKTVTEHLPQAASWDFSTDQQIQDLVDGYWPIQAYPAKNLAASTITVPDAQLKGAIADFQKRLTKFQQLETELISQYPDRCHTVTYEMWQQDAAAAAASLSQALGIAVTADDVQNLAIRPDNINYDQCFANLTDIQAQYQQAFGS